MKKVFLILAGLLTMVVGFLAMANGNDDIAFHCVITTCFGTHCRPEFADLRTAVEFSNLAETICDILW